MFQSLIFSTFLLVGGTASTPEVNVMPHNIVSNIGINEYYGSSRRSRIYAASRYHDVSFVRIVFIPGYESQIVSLCSGYGLQCVSRNQDYAIFAVNGCGYKNLVRIANHRYVRFVHPHHRR